MKKSILTIMILTFSINVIAEVPLKFNMHGEFVPPDMILQARGLDAYEKGFLEPSLTNFKKSAQFGNDRSKYLIALLSFQNKDWASGYAWLGLINGSMENKDGLMEKVKTMLSADELNNSANILKGLRKEYNDNSSLRRRNKWEKSFKGIGTHISGLYAMSLRDGTMNFGDNAQRVTSYELKKQVQSYVYEYEPRGIVEMGVIKEIENRKER